MLLLSDGWMGYEEVSDDVAVGYAVESGVLVRCVMGDSGYLHVPESSDVDEFTHTRHT